MKKFLLFLTVCITLSACGLNPQEKEGSAHSTELASPSMEEGVEVLYFHGKQRCPTCIAIEKHTQAALDSLFGKELKGGQVVFRSIDISQRENEAVAEKYEVTWSSLFIIKHKDGKETAENMTEFAFGNARKSPEVFKNEVAKKINDMLN